MTVANDLVGDDGVTLSEMTVTMLVLGIMSALTVVAVANFGGLTTISSELSGNAHSVRHATNEFSRDARNVSQVFEPGVVGDFWYTEYCTSLTDSVDGSRSSEGELTGECIQWRLSLETGQLSRRSVLSIGGRCAAGAEPTAWRSLAADLSNSAGIPPLQWDLGEIRGEYPQARTELHVDGNKASTMSSTRFTLYNSDGKLYSNIVELCPALRRVNP